MSSSGQEHKSQKSRKSKKKKKKTKQLPQQQPSSHELLKVNAVIDIYRSSSSPHKVVTTDDCITEKELAIYIDPLISYTAHNTGGIISIIRGYVYQKRDCVYVINNMCDVIRITSTSITNIGCIGRMEVRESYPLHVMCEMNDRLEYFYWSPTNTWAHRWTFDLTRFSLHVKEGLTPPSIMPEGIATSDVTGPLYYRDGDDNPRYPVYTMFCDGRPMVITSPSETRIIHPDIPPCPLACSPLLNVVFRDRLYLFGLTTTTFYPTKHLRDVYVLSNTDNKWVHVSSHTPTLIGVTPRSIVVVDDAIVFINTYTSLAFWYYPDKMRWETVSFPHPPAYDGIYEKLFYDPSNKLLVAVTPPNMNVHTIQMPYVERLSKWTELKNPYRSRVDVICCSYSQ